jgi:hypothetical protein
MDGRAFLDAASALAGGGAEAFWRSCVGRAYYALLHEGRSALERWGFSVPPKADLHAFVRMRFSNPSDADLKQVGKVVEDLSRRRNHADYRLSSPGPFTSPTIAHAAVANATKAIDLLDQLDADPARRAAAVAAIQAAFPP